MSDDFCAIHGYTLRYDMRSGFDICDLCEKEKVMTTPESKAAKLLKLAFQLPRNHGYSEYLRILAMAKDESRAAAVLGRKGGRSKSESK